MVHSRLVEAGTDIVVEGEVGDMASRECELRQLACWPDVGCLQLEPARMNLRLSVPAGSPGDCMYILSRGDAELFKGDEMIEKAEECHLAS